MSEEQEIRQLTEEQKKILEHHYANFKRQLKTQSKGQLIAMLWQQGMQIKELQHHLEQVYKKETKDAE